MPIRVVIYEDNVFLRNSTAELIRSSDGLELMGAFENCDHVDEQLQELHPDVVLMDIEMEGTDGLEGLKIIRKKFENVQVIMLTVFDDNDRVFEAICNGAAGYLLKKTPPEKIILEIPV